jgi:hypothetical protein
VAKPVPELTMLPEQQEKVRRLVEAVSREVAKKEQPLIVGPWTGEVGYELLYWIPFVRWALSAGNVLPERVTVVSRGGTASWYSGIPMGHYVDAFDVMSPAELAVLGEGAKPKQSATSDEGAHELLRRVLERYQLRDVARILPHWMYRLYRFYWDAVTPVDFVEQYAHWRRIVPASEDAVLAELPPHYVAVRFYFSRSFPASDSNREFAQRMIARLADDRPVVLLSHNLALDDHQDYEPPSGTVIPASRLMTPSTNLAIQTAIIGRAAAFVGTYGGLSLLPPLCGVRSFAYASIPFMKPTHAQVIDRMIARANGAALRVEDPRDGTAQAEDVIALLERDGAGR